MEYVRLGLTDLKISRVGFGCATMGGYDYGYTDDHDSIAAVHKALDLGVNFFDTADVYGFGHAEEVLSEALGSCRHDVVVATKFGVKWDEQGRTTRDISPPRVMQALDASLRRLKLDSVPLYQIHWPDRDTPIGETIEALKKCQESGKIRALGCCNFPVDLVEDEQAHCQLTTLQLPYSLAQRDFEETIRVCHQKYTISALCYNPLAQGLLTGKYGPNATFEGTDLRRRSELFSDDKFTAALALLDKLKIVGERCGRTPAQVAIQWILENPSVSCVITGIKKPLQIEENVGALGGSLSAVDFDFLSAG